MSPSKSDLILSSFAGTIGGLWLAHTFGRSNNRPSVHFIKSTNSPFPIHPDEQKIMIDEYQMAHSDGPIDGARCLFIPSHWNFADMEIRALRNMEPRRFQSSLFSVCLLGHDFLACKGSLARLCRKFLTKEQYDRYLPESWPVESWNWLHEQIHRHHIHPDSLLIVKTNLQRQTATFVYRAKNLPTSDDLKEKEVVVIQRLLSNPLCVHGRKVTLRVYVLCYVSSSARRMWRFSNGFVYYSKKAYSENSDDLGSQIASGYGDRDVYHTRPLTLHDLWRNSPDTISSRYCRDIDACLKSTVGTLMKHHEVIENVPQGSFQLFGCDIFLKDYDVCSQHSSLAVLLEVNKAPDLTYKSERDGVLKRSLIRKMWLLVTRPNLLDIPKSATLQNDLREEEMEDTWLDLI